MPRVAVTKFVLLFWLDCPKPCSDVLHEKHVLPSDEHPNLKAGQERVVEWGKKQKRARVIKRGKSISISFFVFVFELSFVMRILLLSYRTMSKNNGFRKTWFFVRYHFNVYGNSFQCPSGFHFRPISFHHLYELCTGVNQTPWCHCGHLRR